MANNLEANAQRFMLDDLTALADSANAILDGLRTNMLEPHPRKKAPTFTGAQVADLARFEPSKMKYLVRTRPDLPSGTQEAAGKRRIFSLAEARVWIKALGKYQQRPAGARAACIAVVNFKGGSTKTTTAFNLAQALTLRGRRVLLVDLDPQGSATTLTGLLPAAEVTEEMTALAITLEPPHKQEDLRYAVQETYWDGLDLIPAAPSLFSAEIFLPLQSKDPRKAWWDVVNRAIDPLRDEYDVIIFDTAPALSYLAVNAVIAADGLLMPIPPDNLDYASSVAFWTLLSETLSLLRENKDYTKDFAFMRVLLSRVDSDSIPASIVKSWIIRTYGHYVLPVELPRSKVTSAAAVQFGSVYDVTKTQAKLRLAYESFAEMIDQQIVTTVWQVGNKAGREVA